MSTISSIQPLISSSIYNPSNFKSPPLKNHSFAINFHRNLNFTHNWHQLKLTHDSKLRKLKSAEEDAQIPESTEDGVVAEQEEVSPDQTETVAVPVSPSDKLLMYFQAEGTLNDSAIPNVTQALEEDEGVSNVKVHISEGIASVELTKQTTIQATGVASSLLEAIQGAGFKLQTLNLSFEDEELLAGV